MINPKDILNYEPIPNGMIDKLCLVDKLLVLKTFYAIALECSGEYKIEESDNKIELEISNYVPFTINEKLQLLFLDSYHKQSMFDLKKTQRDTIIKESREYYRYMMVDAPYEGPYEFDFSFEKEEARDNDNDVSKPNDDCNKDSVNNRINEQLIEQDEESKKTKKIEKKSKTIKWPDEWQTILSFFDDENYSKAFYLLFCHTKKKNKSVVIEVRHERGAIIGVKNEGERLRYYADESGTLKFCKGINGDEKLLEIDDANLDYYYNLLDDVDSYFKEHNSEVKLQPKEEKEKTSYHYRLFDDEDDDYNSDDLTCPLCGGRLILKTGRRGKFYGCESWPECSYTCDCDDEDDDDRCPWCGAELELKHGRYGAFYGCSRFPKCRYTRDV